MAHVWINGLDGQWYNAVVPSLADFTALDESLFQSVNGDGGGTWTPTADINVGGAGMWFAGPSTIGSSAALTTGSGQYITFGDSDYVELVNSHTGATRTLCTMCMLAVAPVGWGLNSSFASQLESQAIGAHAVIPLRVHQNATLTQAVLTLVVSTTHANVPATLPGMRVCQRDQDGNVTPLTVGDANGFAYFPTPVSGSAWYAAGAAQTLTVAVTPTVIDRYAYSYFAEIVDEAGYGALTGNLYNDIDLTFTTILDTRPS